MRSATGTARRPTACRTRARPNRTCLLAPCPGSDPRRVSTRRVQGQTPDMTRLDASRGADARAVVLAYVRHMARVLRTRLPAEGVYHVCSRGVARRSIYLDDADRRLFL